MDKKKILFGITNFIAWGLLIYCFVITYRISTAVSLPRYVVLTNELTHVIFRDSEVNTNNVSVNEHTIRQALESVKTGFHAYKLGSRVYNWVDLDHGGTYTLGDVCEYGTISRIYPSRLVMADGTIVENTFSRSPRHETNQKTEPFTKPETKPPI